MEEYRGGARKPTPSYFTFKTPDLPGPVLVRVCGGPWSWFSQFGAPFQCPFSVPSIGPVADEPGFLGVVDHDPVALLELGVDRVRLLPPPCESVGVPVDQQPAHQTKFLRPEDLHRAAQPPPFERLLLPLPLAVLVLYARGDPVHKPKHAPPVVQFDPFLLEGTSYGIGLLVVTLLPELLAVLAVAHDELERLGRRLALVVVDPPPRRRPRRHRPRRHGRAWPVWSRVVGSTLVFFGFSPLEEARDELARVAREGELLGPQEVLQGGHRQRAEVRIHFLPRARRSHGLGHRLPGRVTRRRVTRQRGTRPPPPVAVLDVFPDVEGRAVEGVVPHLAHRCLGRLHSLVLHDSVVLALGHARIGDFATQAEVVLEVLPIDRLWDATHEDAVPGRPLVPGAEAGRPGRTRAEV
mmetsp:Transcript_67342/g.152383  ORF Transcript_67342/g.152383 Transcript_67342/m.152383 type:complete len:409 (-) Transcript_67342:170-1396(-)